MGRETRKNDRRREGTNEYSVLFTGQGIDIGCGPCPVTHTCDRWDKAQGDATYMKGVEDESYDWVHSSHCLEHLDSPLSAIHNWWRILRPEGHLILTVPCFFLYEHKTMPSQYNSDHKQAFSILPTMRSFGILAMFQGLPGCQIRWVRTNDQGFDYSDKTRDQTRGHAQAEIEVVAKKIDPWWTEYKV